MRLVLVLMLSVVALVQADETNRPVPIKTEVLAPPRAIFGSEPKVYQSVQMVPTRAPSISFVHSHAMFSANRVRELGKRSAALNVPATANPYVGEGNRVQWLSAWLDEKENMQTKKKTESEVEVDHD